MSITRRSFLVKTVGATTGLIIGFRHDCAAKVDEATKVFSPNAFIEISVNDEVRLWATRSEMGQGVRTLLPMVLADELGELEGPADCAWSNGQKAFTRGHGPAPAGRPLVRYATLRRLVSQWRCDR